MDASVFNSNTRVTYKGDNVKLLLENWREYLNENEDEDPFLEKYKQVIREEVQNELLRESHYGFKEPYATEQMILWNVKKTIINSADSATKLKGEIYKRFKELLPDQKKADPIWQTPGIVEWVNQTNMIMGEVAIEVDELYSRILQISDEDMEKKIWGMVYAVDGVGWLQALEILRTIQ